jgi:hypothetical protein
MTLTKISYEGRGGGCYWFRVISYDDLQYYRDAYSVSIEIVCVNVRMCNFVH